MRNRFVDPKDPQFVFKTEYHKRIPADGLPHYLGSIWEQVMTNKDSIYLLSRSCSLNSVVTRLPTPRLVTLLPSIKDSANTLKVALSSKPSELIWLCTAPPHSPSSTAMQADTIKKSTSASVSIYSRSSTRLSRPSSWSSQEPPPSHSCLVQAQCTRTHAQRTQL